MPLIGLISQFHSMRMITCWHSRIQALKFAYSRHSVPGTYPTRTTVHCTHHILTSGFSSMRHTHPTLKLQRHSPASSLAIECSQALERESTVAHAELAILRAHPDSMLHPAKPWLPELTFTLPLILGMIRTKDVGCKEDTHRLQRRHRRRVRLCIFLCPVIFTSDMRRFGSRNVSLDVAFAAFC